MNPSSLVTDARSNLLKGENVTKRAMLWKLVLGVGNIDAKEYVRLVELGPSTSEQAIQRDLSRALAGDPEASALRDGRIRLLNAYAHAESGTRKCEYKQGMGGAAASLLYVLNEVEAYAAFRALMHTWAPGLYQTGHDTVALGCAVADEVLAWADSELHAFLVRTYSTGRAYADLMFYSRVASLYATRGPLLCVARVWDCILGMGAHAVPLLCVAECCMRRDELMEAGRDAITRFQNIGGSKGPHQGGGRGEGGGSQGDGMVAWEWNRLQPDAVETMCALVLRLESSIRGHDDPEQMDLAERAALTHLQTRLQQFALLMAGLPAAPEHAAVSESGEAAHPAAHAVLQAEFVHPPVIVVGGGEGRHRPRKSWSEDDAGRCVLVTSTPSDSVDAVTSSSAAPAGSGTGMGHESGPSTAGPASAAARIGGSTDAATASPIMSSPPISEPNESRHVGVGHASRRTPTSAGAGTSGTGGGSAVHANTAFDRRKAYYQGLRAHAASEEAPGHGRAPGSGSVPHLGLYDTVSVVRLEGGSASASGQRPSGAHWQGGSAGSRQPGLPPVPPATTRGSRGVAVGDSGSRVKTTTSTSSSGGIAPPVIPSTSQRVDGGRAVRGVLRRTSAISEASNSGSEAAVKATRVPSQRMAASVDASTRKSVVSREQHSVPRPSRPAAARTAVQVPRLGSAATLVRKIPVTEQ